MSFCGSTRIDAAYCGIDRISHGYFQGERISFDVRPFPMFRPSSITRQVNARITLPQLSDFNRGLEVSDDGTVLYIACGGPTGALFYSLDIATKTKISDFSIDSGVDPGGVVLIDNILYLGSITNGDLDAYDEQTGRRLPQYDWSSGVSGMVTACYDYQMGNVLIAPHNNTRVFVFSYNGPGDFTARPSLTFTTTSDANGLYVSHDRLWSANEDTELYLQQRDSFSAGEFSTNDTINFTFATSVHSIAIWNNTIYAMEPRQGTVLDAYIVAP